ncbi:MAG: hypothetical protein ACREJO_10965, partial [Phycisphaerales bacterium]
TTSPACRLHRGVGLPPAFGARAFFTRGGTCTSVPPAPKPGPIAAYPPAEGRAFSILNLPESG